VADGGTWEAMAALSEYPEAREAKALPVTTMSLALKLPGIRNPLMITQLGAVQQTFVRNWHENGHYSYNPL
jgi:hypothetical protein